MWRLLSILSCLLCTTALLWFLYWIATAESANEISDGPHDNTQLQILQQSTTHTHNDVHVTLRCPLNSFSPAIATQLKTMNTIEAIVLVPENAPGDLHVGAYIKNQDGQWFQSPYAQALHVGKNTIRFALEDKTTWQAEPDQRYWNAYHQAQAQSYGLYFSSAITAQSEIIIRYINTSSLSIAEHSQYSQKLFIDEIDGIDTANCVQNGEAIAHARTGERWQIRMHPAHMPLNPFAHDELDIQLHLEHQQLGEIKINAFYMQGITFSDRGDREEPHINSAGHYIVRFRPRIPGKYSAFLSMRSHGSVHKIPLPPLHVSGADWDDYVRVDQQDPRFYSVAADNSHKKKQFWPIGVNLRSVTDPRSGDNTDARSTVNRGSLSYAAYLDRYANAGANCAEIWMCSWNLALEWRKNWPGFKGVGYYNQDNAQRLDDILDRAYANGIRIILVLNNHGQASSKVDSEWKHNPYNAIHGGPVRRADDLFTNEQGIALQRQLRRYIVARYADHPAILSWKLWTEMDLTNEGLKTMRGRRKRPSIKLRTWHKNACDDFHAWDIYKHPVVTHWSTDYLMVDRGIAALPELDALCIDAYHNHIPGHKLLAQFLSDSTLNPRKGLNVFKKPVHVTEYGGTPMACAPEQLFAEHLSAPWAALVSGHGGSPLLWWFEWIDQHDHWQPYQAISRFIANEDLRGATRSVKLTASDSSSKTQRKLWSRAWAKKGRILGYVLDYQWGYLGVESPLIDSATLFIGKKVAPGEISLEWWDASNGTIVRHNTLTHPGGALSIPIPPFRRHLAFKLSRR